MKKIAALVCFLFMLMPLQAYAHSKMTTSSPVENAVLTESPEQISLTFNTSISSVSTFTLVDEAATEQVIDNISVDHDTLSGEVTGQLASGSYTVEWNVIGEDGHAVKGTYGFSVELAEVEQPTSDPLESSQPELESDAEANETSEPTSQPVTSTPEPSSSETDIDQSTDTDSGDQGTEKDSQPIWPYIVIAVIVIAILVVAVRKRK